jgi:hypothetical protein
MIMNSKTLSDALNGGASASFTAFLTQPLQVIRTSMIVIYKEGKVSKMKDIYSRILKEEGYKGFYRGLVPSLLKTTIGSAIYFATLERIKDIFHKKHIEDRLKNKDQKYKHNFVNFTSAAVARFIQTTLINPIYVIKTRYEVVGFKSYNSIMDAIIKIKRDEGYKAYFYGLRQTLAKDVPSSAVFYSLYEFFKRVYSHYFGIKNLQILATSSSLTTNIILIFLTNPFDVLRTRLQFQHFSQNSQHKYKGIISGIYHISKEEGYRGLCVGIVPRFMKKAISSIIVWTSYETLKLQSQKKRDLLMQDNQKADFRLKD